jgi:hypothetical protein
MLQQQAREDSAGRAVAAQDQNVLHMRLQEVRPPAT